MKNNSVEEAKPIKEQLEKLGKAQELKHEIQKQVVRQFQEETIAAEMTEDDIDNLVNDIGTNINCKILANYVADKTAKEVVQKQFSLTSPLYWRDKAVNLVVGVASFALAGYARDRLFSQKSEETPTEEHPFSNNAVDSNHPFSDPNVRAKTGTKGNVVHFDGKAS